MNRRIPTICAVLVCLTTGWVAAEAQQHGKIEVANPNIKGDGTRSKAAQRAITRGPLPRSEEEVAMKAEADRAAAEEMKSSKPSGRSALPEGAPAPTRNAPAVVSSQSFAGQRATDSSPSDSTGTIGPFSYIQAVNTSVRIYNRTTHAPIATGTLNQLAQAAASVDTFDPQVMWDPTTDRFYYVIDAVFSASNNKLAFGFSKTNNPANVTTDWCHYFYTPTDPARFPDYPKLGDSESFLVIGVNSFDASEIFLGSDLIAISKPGAGTTCPAFATFKTGTKLDLRDTSNRRVFTPVPSNQVDDSTVSHVVARNGSLPSNQLWFFSVGRNATTGKPIFGAARGVAVPSYTLPPNAAQPAPFSQVLDTLDARPTQAVQAFNPTRGVHSFYVQHTVRHPSQALSIVRWYEIDSAPASPVILRSGQIAGSNKFFFNAAISPDRRKDGALALFGDSFVIQYNQSSRVDNIAPRIVAGSSLHGGALTFKNIRNGVSGYRDFTCPSGSQICRWGDYSSAMPDPRPTTVGVGEVWITNQYSGIANPPANDANFRTWISAIQP
jgi:hypothetical protein